MNDQDMKREVIVAFEYSYLHDSWVNPLEEALEGVTAEQALWKPGPESKGIWEIVLHWTVWGDNIVERIETGKPTRPREEDWPPLPAVTDEAAWEEAKNRLRASLDSIRRTI